MNALRTYATPPMDGATYAKLVSQYGRERAEAIRLGRDSAYNSDICLWRRLGRRK